MKRKILIAIFCIITTASVIAAQYYYFEVRPDNTSNASYKNHTQLPAAIEGSDNARVEVTKQQYENGNGFHNVTQQMIDDARDTSLTDAADYEKWDKRLTALVEVIRKNMNPVPTKDEMKLKIRTELVNL